MDYTLQQSSDPSSWMYSSQHDSLRTNITHEPLQEPVPFEDFQFSFGLDPGFVMPVPLDMPEPPNLNDSNHLLSSMDYQLGEENHQDYTPLVSSSNNPLLDENDQKVFSQFLDAFFVDKDGQMSNAEEMANQFSTMYDATQPPPPLLLNDHGYHHHHHHHHHPPPPPPPALDPYHVATSMFLPKPRPSTIHNNNSYHHDNNDEDEDDEHRRSSILQSLDQQKQFHQRLNRVVSVQQLTKENTTPSPTTQESIGPNAIFLQQSNQVSVPFITKHPTSTSQRYHTPQHSPYPPPEQRQQQQQQQQQQDRSSSRSLSTPTRRNKSHKELLTEEEKRSNHIASEQKRRSTIRNGFKDLTDIVPTLKNINNSKSTVLFKAVDYIKYLEKRNNNLRDKMGSLEVRIKVEGRVSDLLMHHHPQQQPQQPQQQPQQQMSCHSSPTHSESSPPSDTSSTSSSHGNESISHSNHSNHSNGGGGGGGVAAALLAHKSQQKQLMALQEQLQYHQRLLAQQDDPSSSSSSSSTSSSHSSPQSSDLYQHQSQPSSQSRWTFDSKSTSRDNHHHHHHHNNNNNNNRMDVDTEEPLKVSA